VAGGEKHFAFNSVLAQFIFGLASFLSPKLYIYFVRNLQDVSVTKTFIIKLLSYVVPNNLPWISLYWFFSILTLLMIIIIAVIRIPKVELKEDERIGSRDNFVLLLKNKIVVFYFIGIIAVIFSIPSLQSLSIALFTGAGVVGIIIGFAAQSTLSNIIAGISLAIFQPFRVGDRLDIMNEYGKVADLNLRHTVIITWDNRRLIIPNSKISNEAIINWTIEDPAVIWPIDVGISYDADIDKARKIMIEEARKHTNVMPHHEVKYSVIKPSLLKSDILNMGFIDAPVLNAVDPDFRERGIVKVNVTELGEYSVKLRLLVWFKDRSVAFGSGCEIREAIKKRFDEEGIEIPYPHRTIIFKEEIEKGKKGAEKLASSEDNKIRISMENKVKEFEN